MCFPSPCGLYPATRFRVCYISLLQWSHKRRRKRLFGTWKHADNLSGAWGELENPNSEFLSSYVHEAEFPILYSTCTSSPFRIIMRRDWRKVLCGLDLECVSVQLFLIETLIRDRLNNLYCGADAKSCSTHDQCWPSSSDWT